jgi:predicted RNA-binding Zn ribbon-like protein
MTISQAEGQQQPFELIAGNLCLDFVNTLDDRPTGKPKELLKDYHDLARFGREAGILTPTQLDHLLRKVHLKSEDAEEALRHARKLREALYVIFSALIKGKTASQAALDKLNSSLHDAALHSRLVQQKGRWELSFDDLASSFGAVLWPIARDAAELLASDQLQFVRACSSDTCQWFFLDTSKNHHRRWCSMKSCGNRAKVRRFYARKETA